MVKSDRCIGLRSYSDETETMAERPVLTEVVVFPIASRQQDREKEGPKTTPPLRIAKRELQAFDHLAQHIRADSKEAGRGILQGV